MDSSYSARRLSGNEKEPLKGSFAAIAKKKEMLARLTDRGALMKVFQCLLYSSR